MPNWCHNTLEISGEEKDLVAFIERVKDDDILNILHQGDGNPGCDPEFTDGKLICHFYTRYIPPVEWVEGIARAFPDLTFDLSYSEIMTELYGKRVFNGNTITILDYCDGCVRQEKCNKGILTAILTLMRIPAEKWPEVPSCKRCFWGSLCALIGGGHSCIAYGCWSRKIEPFHEFIETKGTVLRPIQTSKKDFKRYRKIDLKS
jgi:hypothetical protein